MFNWYIDIFAVEYAVYKVEEALKNGIEGEFAMVTAALYTDVYLTRLRADGRVVSLEAEYYSETKQCMPLIPRESGYVVPVVGLLYRYHGSGGVEKSNALKLLRMLSEPSTPYDDAVFDKLRDIKSIDGNFNVEIVTLRDL